MNSIDDILRRQREHIDRAGWSVVAVLPTLNEPGTAFAYTVGLTAHDFPELLIAGLHPNIAHTLLNTLAAPVWDRAERYEHGQRITDLLAAHHVVIVDGPASVALFPGAAVALYGRDRVRLQQVVWPDPRGHFPWELAYHLGPEVQPVIGRP